MTPKLVIWDFSVMSSGMLVVWCLRLQEEGCLPVNDLRELL